MEIGGSTQKFMRNKPRKIRSGEELKLSLARHQKLPMLTYTLQQLAWGGETVMLDKALILCCSNFADTLQKDPKQAAG